jgi:hypothetical protein
MSMTKLIGDAFFSSVGGAEIGWDGDAVDLTTVTLAFDVDKYPKGTAFSHASVSFDYDDPSECVLSLPRLGDEEGCAEFNFDVTLVVTPQEEKALTPCKKRSAEEEVEEPPAKKKAKVTFEDDAVLQTKIQEEFEDGVCEPGDAISEMLYENGLNVEWHFEKSAHRVYFQGKGGKLLYLDTRIHEAEDPAPFVFISDGEEED